jgi:hypothetical protein
VVARLVNPYKQPWNRLLCSCLPRLFPSLFLLLIWPSKTAIHWPVRHTWSGLVTQLIQLHTVRNACNQSLCRSAQRPKSEPLEYGFVPSSMDVGDGQNPERPTRIRKPSGCSDGGDLALLSAGTRHCLGQGSGATTSAAGAELSELALLKTSRVSSIRVRSGSFPTLSAAVNSECPRALSTSVRSPILQAPT